MRGSFQTHVVIDQFRGVAIEGQHTNPFALALDTDLQFRELLSSLL